MFAKPYKIKCHTTLKNSEKKALIQRVLEEFPSATEEKVKMLVPAKSTCSCMKMMLHSGELIDVYVMDGIPLMLATRGTLLPSVCALWRMPDLLPSLTIQAAVLPKGGAPLYLPGVVVPTSGAGFPMFARGARLAARTQDNAAAAAVGFAALASGEMLLKVGGVCLDVVHWTGDQLCRDPKLSKVERPRLAPPPQGQGDHTAQLAAELRQVQLSAPPEWPSLPEPRAPAPSPAPREPGMKHATTTTAGPFPPPGTLAKPAPPGTHAAHGTHVSHGTNPTPALQTAPEPHADAPAHAPPSSYDENSATEADSDPVPEDPDGLLRWMLLSFLKTHAKTIELPIKSSLLYRNYLLPLCPPDRTVDIKKTTYKKVSKFLEAMQQEGFLEVREVEKGVDAVCALHAEHPAARAHAPRRAPAAAPPPGEPEYEPPRVRDLYALTAPLAEIFAPLKKGTTLTGPQVRDSLTQYVKAHNLNSTVVKGAVKLDDALARVANLQPQEVMKWEALSNCVKARLTPCTEMSFSDGTVRLTKTKLEPITMHLVSRSGNKKVTLVSNLEAFGFYLPALARAWQRGAAAAASVTRAPGAKHDQLQLQGDQSYFVAKTLVEKYGLPKKFVDGADKALKKKKGT